LRRAARQDSNHHDIAQIFEDAGFSVLHMHQLGRGAPDMLVGCPGVNVLIEVKDGSKKPSAQKLSPDEERFFGAWLGPIALIHNEEEARQLIQSLAGGDGETIH